MTAFGERVDKTTKSQASRKTIEVYEFNIDEKIRIECNKINDMYFIVYGYSMAENEITILAVSDLSQFVPLKTMIDNSNNNKMTFWTLIANNENTETFSRYYAQNRDLEVSLFGQIGLLSNENNC